MLKSKNKLLHKALAFVLTFSLLATLVSFNFTANALEESGTASDPYIIDDVGDLTAFAILVNDSNSSACARLSNTFDNTDNPITSWTPIGNADHKFTGVFDGNGKTITFNNINVNNGYVGLFGINEGTIKNVTVTGSISSSTEKAFVGGVAGLNRGTITNCTNSATISATGANSYAGGIAGVMQYGTIDTCTNSGNISVTVAEINIGDITNHEASVGGIVAFNYNGTVKKSTNTGNIENNDSHGYTGGIVGNNDGVIDNCLNSENATITNSNASSYVGGIAGNLFTNSDTGATSKISNTLNLNTNVNGIVGSNGISTKESTKGVIENSFYQVSDNEDETNNDDGTTGVTNSTLMSGEVTYKLNGESVVNPVWGQTIEENNTLPVIGASENTVVYPNTDNNGYTNNKPTACTGSHSYENGVCTKCFDVAAKVSGYSVTLDGTIGLNFYYEIANTITLPDNPTITYTKTNGEQKITTGTSSLIQDTKHTATNNYKIYVATVPVDSDQMNLNITTSLKYDSSSEDSVSSKAYNVNQYLNKLYSDPISILGTENANKADSLKELAQFMSTYGYYANEYFADYTHYETTIPEAQLSITSNTGKLADTKYDLSYGTGTDSDMSHYASSLQHLETIAGVFYVNGVTNTENSKMAYRILNVDSENAITGYENNVFSPITKQGAYAWAFTDKIPVSMLGKIKFEVTFGTYEDSAYNAKTKIKYYSPYGYIKSTLTKYSNDTESSIYKLTQALYHYSEAAAAYFPA